MKLLDHLRHLVLLVGVQMAVDLQSGLDIFMPQPLGDEQGRKSFFDQKTGVAVPLRYNYDKPEKPRRIKA